MSLDEVEDSRCKIAFSHGACVGFATSCNHGMIESFIPIGLNNDGLLFANIPDSGGTASIAIDEVAKIKVDNSKAFSPIPEDILIEKSECGSALQFDTFALAPNESYIAAAIHPKTSCTDGRFFLALLPRAQDGRFNASMPEPRLSVATDTVPNILPFILLTTLNSQVRDLWWSSDSSAIKVITANGEYRSFLVERHRGSSDCSTADALATFKVAECFAALPNIGCGNSTDRSWARPAPTLNFQDENSREITLTVQENIQFLHLEMHGSNDSSTKSIPGLSITAAIRNTGAEMGFRESEDEIIIFSRGITSLSSDGRDWLLAVVFRSVPGTQGDESPEQVDYFTALVAFRLSGDYSEVAKIYGCRFNDIPWDCECDLSTNHFTFTRVRELGALFFIGCTCAADAVVLAHRNCKGAISDPEGLTEYAVVLPPENAQLNATVVDYARVPGIKAFAVMGTSSVPPFSNIRSNDNDAVKKHFLVFLGQTGGVLSVHSFAASSDDMVSLTALLTTAERSDNSLSSPPIADKDVAEENITEEDVAEENITEEDVAEENITEEDVAEDVAEENITEEDITEENVTEEDIAEGNVTEEDTAEEGVIHEDVAEAAIFIVPTKLTSAEVMFRWNAFLQGIRFKALRDELQELIMAVSKQISHMEGMDPGLSVKVCLSLKNRLTTFAYEIRQKLAAARESREAFDIVAEGWQKACRQYIVGDLKSELMPILDAAHYFQEFQAETAGAESVGVIFWDTFLKNGFHLLYRLLMNPKYQNPLFTGFQNKIRTVMFPTCFSAAKLFDKAQSLGTLFKTSAPISFDTSAKLTQRTNRFALDFMLLNEGNRQDDPKQFVPASSQRDKPRRISLECPSNSSALSVGHSGKCADEVLARVQQLHDYATEITSLMARVKDTLRITQVETEFSRKSADNAPDKSECSEIAICTPREYTQAQRKSVDFSKDPLLSKLERDILNLISTPNLLGKQSQSVLAPQNLQKIPVAGRKQTWTTEEQRRSLNLRESDLTLLNTKSALKQGRMLQEAAGITQLKAFPRGASYELKQNRWLRQLRS